MIAAGTENVQVVELPIVDSLHPRPPFMPQAIPADLAPRLMRLHGHPFVWWISQFVSYLFRLQPRLVTDIEQMKGKLGFLHPIVGSVSLSVSFIPSRGTGHHPDPFQEAPQASWVALVMKVGPRLPPRLLVCWAV